MVLDVGLTESDKLVGCLLGVALGDALGLPMEGLSARRSQRMRRGVWRMNLVLGRGMVSDDTEHTWMVAQTLLEAPGDVAQFRRRLARRFRWWLVALPAGVGKATAQACLKLWLGISPERSGVFSAGNGPAMRSAVLGAFIADDQERRREYVRASTRMTHTDPKAEAAALAVAEAAAWAVQGGIDVAAFVERVLPKCGIDEAWLALCRQIREALLQGKEVTAFAESLGLSRGVSGYAYHTVPVAIYAWLRHRGDFRGALCAALDCGGDSDSVGAIVGGLAGVDVGPNGLPQEWLTRLWEWPRGVTQMKQLGGRLAKLQTLPAGSSLSPVTYVWPAIPFRNAFFLAVIIAHGFRRLLPPYG